jgi:hypothetical protein
MSAGAREVGLSALAFLAAGAGACASDETRSQRRDSIGGAISQPLRDVSLLREAPPPVLSRALADPYALPLQDLCAAIVGEIAELDAVLGPDLNAVETTVEPSITDDLAASAIGDVVKLPFRGVVRSGDL